MHFVTRVERQPFAESWPEKVTRLTNWLQGSQADEFKAVQEIGHDGNLGQAVAIELHRRQAKQRQEARVLLLIKARQSSDPAVRARANREISGDLHLEHLVMSELLRRQFAPREGEPLPRCGTGGVGITIGM